MTAEFRSSKFVDFDSGEVSLPPMQLLQRKKRPWNLQDKIEIFECKVDVWQLGVAARMLKEMEAPQRKAIWSHAAYGLVAIIFSYFEMIGKTVNPGSKKRHTAGPDFKAAFCDVYPRLRSASGKPLASVSQFPKRSATPFLRRCRVEPTEFARQGDLAMVQGQVFSGPGG